jgi:hypothetical protein
MYANFVEVVIRQTDSPFGGDVEDAITFRVDPRDEDVDAAAITQDARRWAIQRGYGRFLFEENRHFTDAGAEGASVQFVLELLAAGATGVALQEIVNFFKGRLNASDDNLFAEFFRDSTTEELRDLALSEAERALELRRGDFELDHLDRENFEIRLRARSRSTGRVYRIAKNADGMMRLRRLD